MTPRVRLTSEQLARLRRDSRVRVPDRIVAELRAAGIAARRDDDSGDVVMREARGFESRAAFDADGQCVAFVRPSGGITRFGYDHTGRLSSIDGANGRRIEIRGAPADGTVTLSQPGLSAYRLTHDTEGRLTGVSGPEQFRRTIAYGPNGTLASLSDSAGARREYRRDANGVLGALVDELGRTTRFETDGGVLARVVFPDGSTEHHAFDPESDGAYHVLRDGSVAIRAFDASGALTAVTWPDDTTLALEHGEHGIVAARTVDSAVAFTYDVQGHVASETTDAGTVRFVHDADGRLLQLETPFGDVIRHEYDEDGRLRAVIDWTGARATFTHDREDAITAIALPNGLVERRWLGASRRVEHAVVTRTGEREPLSEQRYRYDALERLVWHSDASGTSGRTVSTQLDYDRGSRVWREARSDGSAPPVAHEYGYDLKGNMLEADGVPLQVGVMDEPRAFGVHAIAYDGRGNMSELPGASAPLRCRFGADGMMRACETLARIWRYRYDALGRRVHRTDGVRETRFGWAGHQLLWEEHRAGPDAPWVRRLHLLLPGTMLPFAFREAGRTCWLQSDPRGAVIRAFDEQARVVWHGAYDAFGRVDELVAAVRQPWRLLGQYHDDESGLHYSLARYYSPTLRAYLSRDPEWLHPDATNYGYAANDPWNRADPFGALAPLLLVGVAVLVGAAIGTAVAAATGRDPVVGAVEGGIASSGALVALALGAPTAVVLAAGVLSSATGAFVSQLVDNTQKDEELCIPCAARGAGVAAVVDLALLGLGRIPGVKAVASRIARAVRPATAVPAARTTVTRAGRFSRQKAVLGHYPEYKDLAVNLSARRFNIPEHVWNRMSKSQQWAANRKFLDRMVARGDDIILATPLDKVRPGSYFARELEYLASEGYVPSADGTRLVKP